MPESIDEWFSEVEEDFEYAVTLSKNRKYHHSCFLARQVAEKALRAVLLEFGVSKDGGSVLALIDELETLTKVPANITKAAQTLDGYYIPPYFPDASDPSTLRQLYSKERANEALKLARKVIDFARKVASGRRENT